MLDRNHGVGGRFHSVPHHQQVESRCAEFGPRIFPVKVRHASRVIYRAVNLAKVVNMDGIRDLL